MCWNFHSWKTGTLLFYIVNIIAAEGVATQEAKAIAEMTFTWSDNHLYLNCLYTELCWTDGLATSGACSQHFPATTSKVLKRRAPKGVKNSKIQQYFMRVSSLSPRSTPCLPSSTTTPAGSPRVASDIRGAVTARTVATSWRMQWTLTTTGLPWRWWACPRVTFHWPSARAYIW